MQYEKIRGLLQNHFGTVSQKTGLKIRFRIDTVSIRVRHIDHF